MYFNLNLVQLINKTNTIDVFKKKNYQVQNKHLSKLIRTI